MVRQAAVCTSFLPETLTSAESVPKLTTDIYHYALRWAWQISEIESPCRQNTIKWIKIISNITYDR